MTEWQHINYLWGLGALALPVLLFVLYLRWKKNVVKKNKYGAALALLTKNHSRTAFTARFLLLLTAMALLVVSLANLRAPGKGASINRKGIDIVFALDISKSMLAEDVKPNRLERAKLLINKITEEWPDNRTALVVFAGHAYMQMPLTYDYAAARMLVNNASPETAPSAGTAIGEALQMCSAVFGAREKKFKAVVLITDGEDHGEDALREAKNLKDSGAILLAIGMGSETGAQLTDPVTKEFKKDVNGQTVISKLNSALLQQLAQATDGKYIHYTETAPVMTVVKETLGALGKRNIPDKSLVNYTSYYGWFVTAALVLLLAELFIRETKRLKTKTLAV